jgi:hypothetical protein
MNKFHPVSHEPKPQKEVLVFQKHGESVVCFVGSYTKKFEKEACCDSDFMEYCEEKDQYYEPEGWYESQYNWDEYAGIYCSQGNVIGWCELPNFNELVGAGN